MSVFTPGTGGTLKSTDLPGALLETAQLTQIAEQGMSTPKNNVSVSLNSEGTVATITAQLPVTTTVSTDGSIKVVATDYIV